MTIQQKAPVVTMNLKQLSQAMRGIDIAMLSTETDGGVIAQRPMSNNGDVEFDGTSRYFTYENTRTVRDLERNAHVGLGLQNNHDFWVTIVGEGRVIRDRTRFADHWTAELDNWFDNGPDTEGCVMIEVEARRIHFWKGLEQGEIPVDVRMSGGNPSEEIVRNTAVDGAKDDAEAPTG